MKTSEQLAAELKPFLERKRNSCFSEVEKLLEEIHEHLQKMPAFGSASASADAPASPPLKLYHVTLQLEDEFLAESEDDAWEMALDKISDRKGMKLCGEKIVAVR